MLAVKVIASVLTLLSSYAFFFSCGPKTQWPEGLPYGEVVLPNIEDPDTPGAYFDFSAGELVFGEEGKARGDIYLDRTFIATNPNLDVAIYDSQPDSLLYDTTAPSWSDIMWKDSPDGVTPGRISIYKGHNVWVRTAEGHTAKFKILEAEANENFTNYLRIRIRWIYQPDGSTELVSRVGGTENSSQ